MNKNTTCSLVVLLLVAPNPFGTVLRPSVEAASFALNHPKGGGRRQLWRFDDGRGATKSSWKAGGWLEAGGCGDPFPTTPYLAKAASLRVDGFESQRRHTGHHSADSAYLPPSFIPSSQRCLLFGRERPADNGRGRRRLGGVVLSLALGELGGMEDDADDSREGVEASSPNDFGPGSFEDFLAGRDNSEEFEDEDDDDGLQKERKRDKLRKWLGSAPEAGTGASARVEPIRLTSEEADESVEEEGRMAPSPLQGALGGDETKVVKTSFDKLFQDMPSVGDILADNEEEEEETRIISTMGEGQTGMEDAPSSPTPGVKAEAKEEKEEGIRAMLGKDDPTEVKELDASFVRHEEETKRLVADMREEDPESVPLNAETILGSILEEQRTTSVNEAREAIAEKKFEEVEEVAWNELEERLQQAAGGGMQDEAVKEILDELEFDAKERELLEMKLRDFGLYEAQKNRELKSRSVDDAARDLLGGGKEEDVSFEEQTLEILEDIRDRRERLEEDFLGWRRDTIEMEEGSLEEGIKELKTELEKKERRVGGDSVVKPESMKEWQVYHAIRTRLKADRTGDSATEARVDEGEEDREEEEALALLQSWKELKQMEDGMRKDFGLSIQRTMPFRWMEAQATEEPEEEPSALPEEDDDERDADEIRADMNKQSLEFMERLLRENRDGIRKQDLERRVEKLKADIASFEKQRREGGGAKKAATEKKVDSSPIDMTDFFRPEESILDEPRRGMATEGQQLGGATNSADFPPPAVTPDAAATETIKPPDTPFFSSSGDDDDENIIRVKDSLLDKDAPTPTLGTVEEQKLQRMSRQAGLRTDEEQDELRRQYEEFQRAEREMRDRAGLTSREEEEEDAVVAATSDYGRSGDEDSSLAGGGATDESEGNDDPNKPKGVIIVGGEAKRVPSASLADQMYRSIDPGWKSSELRAKDKAEYADFMRKQDEMRKQIQELSAVDEAADDDAEAAAAASAAGGTDERDSEEEGVGADDDFDEEAFADSLLASIGPRPSLDTDTDTSSEEPDYTRDYGDGVGGGGGARRTRGGEGRAMDNIPDWLRQEQEEARSKGELEDEEDDDYFDDDDLVDDVFDDDYEKNLRQIQELERSVRGSDQVPVSVGELFGRDYFGPGDDDYGLSRDRRLSAFSNFDKRKKDLLEYTELTVEDLNLLMENKESVYSTGVNPFIAKIKKPYRSFGAIFRLEGVLLDVTGFQYEAWKKTADIHGYQHPLLEDARLASVTRPDIAAQKVFFWTNDYIECREVARTHSTCFREVFHEWMEQNNITSTVSTDSDSSEVAADALTETKRTPGSIGDDMLGSTSSTSNNADTNDEPSEREATPALEMPTKNEVLDMELDAWKRIAEELAFETPSQEDVIYAGVYSPEEAPEEVFKWTSDPSVKKGIGNAFRNLFKDNYRKWFDQRTPGRAVSTTTPDSATSAKTGGASSLSVDDMLEMQMYAWSRTAEIHGYEPPSLESVRLAASVSVEDAIANVFGWTSKENVNGAAYTYGKELERISAVYEKHQSRKVETGAPKQTPSATVEPSAPTEEDNVMANMNAWTVVAKMSGFVPPTRDAVVLAMILDPDEAVREVFEWVDDRERSQEIVKTFREAFEEEGKRLMAQYHEYLSWVRQRESATVSTKTDETPPLFQLQPGAYSWIKSLIEVDMPCAIISYLERDQVDVLLEQTRLSDLITPDKVVSATDRYDREGQQMLGAALRVERRPDHCAVFDTTPSSSVVAHAVDMKSVAVIGYYPKYEHLTADAATKYLNDLGTVNMRSLFSEAKYDEPQLELGEKKPETKRQLKTRFWEQGDRS